MVVFFIYLFHFKENYKSSFHTFYFANRYSFLPMVLGDLY